MLRRATTVIAALAFYAPQLMMPAYAGTALNVQAWSTTAASNDGADSTIGAVANTSSPTSVDDWTRGVMASIAKYVDDVGGGLVAGGTSTALTVTSNQALSSGHIANGLTLFVRTGSAATGAATIAVDGLSAVTIKKNDGSAIASGDWSSGSILILVYSSTATAFIAANVGPYVQNGTSVTATLGTIELGHASDTTIARASAGNITVEGNAIYRAGGTDVPVADGGTGASTAAGAATNLGLGTGDSPQFTAVNVGNASDTTLSRTAAGRLAVEGKEIGMYLVASGTVSAAATLDIDLTTYTGFRGIKIVLSGFRPATDGDDLWMRFSTDGGSNYATSGYNWALLAGSSDAPTPAGLGSGSDAKIVLASPVGSGSTEGYNGEITMLNQTSAAFWTRVTFSGAYIDSVATPGGNYVTGGGAKETAQDTDAVRFMFSSGNITAGNYAVYVLP